MRATSLSAIFSTVAVLLHSWNEPFGLFLALIVIVVMMRYIRALSDTSSSPLSNVVHRRLPTILAAAVWVAIAWIASTARNGDEILIEGDVIGSSFVVGATAFVALAVIARSKTL